MQATVRNLCGWPIRSIIENFADRNPDRASGPGEIGDVAFRVRVFYPALATLHLGPHPASREVVAYLP